jgi:hypothetical protein
MIEECKVVNGANFVDFSKFDFKSRRTVKITCNKVELAFKNITIGELERLSKGVKLEYTSDENSFKTVEFPTSGINTKKSEMKNSSTDTADNFLLSQYIDDKPAKTIRTLQVTSVLFKGPEKLNTVALISGDAIESVVRNVRAVKILGDVKFEFHCEDKDECNHSDKTGFFCEYDSEQIKKCSYVYYPVEDKERLFLKITALKQGYFFDINKEHKSVTKGEQLDDIALNNNTRDSLYFLILSNLFKEIHISDENGSCDKNTFGTIETPAGKWNLVVGKTNFVPVFTLKLKGVFNVELSKSENEIYYNKNVQKEKLQIKLEDGEILFVARCPAVAEIKVAITLSENQNKKKKEDEKYKILVNKFNTFNVTKEGSETLQIAEKGKVSIKYINAEDKVTVKFNFSDDDKKLVCFEVVKDTKTKVQWSKIDTQITTMAQIKNGDLNKVYECSAGSLGMMIVMTMLVLLF